MLFRPWLRRHHHHPPPQATPTLAEDVTMLFRLWLHPHHHHPPPPQATPHLGRGCYDVVQALTTPPSSPPTTTSYSSPWQRMCWCSGFEHTPISATNPDPQAWLHPHHHYTPWPQAWLHPHHRYTPWPQAWLHPHHRYTPWPLAWLHPIITTHHDHKLSYMPIITTHYKLGGGCANVVQALTIVPSSPHTTTT